MIRSRISSFAAATAIAVLLMTLIGTEAAACPVCDGETGREVRAGVFDESFGSNLLATLLPFLLVAGVAATIHFGGRRESRGLDSNGSRHGH